jgi:GxxExxY protein
MELIYSEETYQIIGACFEVYKRMGCGFLEHVYQECLRIEFDYQKVPYRKEQDIRLSYRETELGKHYRADFICFDKIIVEVKAVSNLSNEHQAQVINYLNASGLEIALLVNFGHYPKLEYKRIILSKDNKPVE